LWLPIVVLLTSACTNKDPDPPATSADPPAAPRTELDLWAGVPPLEPLPSDVRTVLEPRPGPPLPKVVSETIEVPFGGNDDGGPPSGVPTLPPTGPLKIERFGPEGEVALVGAVHVSFSHPMVPLAAVESLAAKTPPFEITPRPEGRVRWLGTRTLVFEPEGRMPFSTDYEVRIPAGVESTDGTKLASDYTFALSTPTLALVSSTPWTGAEQVGLQPVLRLTFNQPIERRALIAATHLRGGGKEAVLAVIPPDPPMPDEAEEIELLRQRTISFVPFDELKPNTNYTLKIDPGVFGEGPKPSGAITVSFSTYPPLRLSQSPCGKCWASSGIYLASTTSISDPMIETKVHVTPTVANISVYGSYSGIQIGGDFEGNTTYTVTVDKGLTDTHGQSLAKPFSTKVRLGPLYPSLTLKTHGPNPAVIERAAAKTIDLSVSGISEVFVDARALTPEELPEFLDAYSSDGDWGWPLRVPAATYSHTHDVTPSLRRKQELSIDLATMISPGHDSVWLIARSDQYEVEGWKDRVGLSKLVQVTDLGITTALDPDSGIVIVTKLSDGSSVAGAAVRLMESGTKGRQLWSGTTDADGLAHPTWSSGRPARLHVQTSDDHAMLRIDQSDLRGTWQSWRTDLSAEPTAFFFTDRQPYKPGETIHLSGIIRNRTSGPDGGIEMWRTDTTGNYTVTSPRGVEVAKGDLKLGKFGTFSLDIPTDDNGDTGDYHFSVNFSSLLSSDRSFSHYIPVETYRTPEFTVAVARRDSTPMLFGDRLVAEVKGEYLHGSPLVGAEVTYSLTRQDTDFRPPGELNDGFTFGVAPAWGGYGGGFGGYGRGGYGGYGGYGFGGGYGPITLASGSGTLDNMGAFSIDHTTQEIELALGATPPDPADVVERLPRAATYSISAAVTDENRQSIAGSGSFVVHPALLYVGVRSQRTVLKEGEQVDLEAVAVDLTGERVRDKAVQLKLLRKETERKAVEKNGRWQFEYETKEVAVADCEVSSAVTPKGCGLKVGKAGTYIVRGTTNDARGHAARTDLTLYVRGKDAVVWDSNEHRVDLVPDKREYKPGDTAVVLVRSPFDDARGVVVVEREGIKLQLPVEIHGGATAVEIPVTESMIPGLTVSAVLSRGRVEVTGAPKGQDLGMPAAASGQVDLVVSNDLKKVFVDIETSAAEIAPGGKLSLKIHTTAAGGAPTKAALAVMVVDEGVLSLMDTQTPDPLTFFHSRRAGMVSLFALHPSVMARDEPPPVPTAVGGLGLMGTGRGGGGTGEGTIGLGNNGLIGHGGGGGTGSGYGRGSGAGPGGRYAMKAESEESAPMARAPAAPAPAMMERKASSNKDKADRSAESDDESGAAFDVGQAMAQEVKLRSVFAATAFYDAEVMTDAAGNASLDIDMPENLTTFRVMVVAVDPDHADRFGSADTSVRVRKPIMVRPSLPRFLNYGDAFEGSVMVDNQTGVDQRVLVGTRGLNVDLGADTQKFVTIPAGESKEVRFDMKVEAVGTMRLQFAAMSNGGRDATQISIPVHYPATSKAFADYGMTDTSIQREIEPPADALSAFGGLDLTFSSTALSGLEDAVDYLVSYPYECAEQTASRVIPIFALGKILDEFPIATVSDRARREIFAAEGVQRLLDKQLWDGGFGYWDAKESWPYLSNWVTFALLEGKRSGQTIDSAALDRALNYVENFVRYGHRTRWGIYYDWTSRAFGLWLLSGEKRGEVLFSTVWSHREDLPLYAQAQLMSAAHRYGKTSERDQLLEEIKKSVVESPSTIHFAESTSEAAAEGLRVLMHSSTQTDAIVLIALLEVAPTDSMLPKIMAGIMGDRDAQQGGRWGTTHSNAWALLAASRYYESVEGAEPDFVAKVWLDTQFGGEHTFKGRSMAKTHQRVPMAALQGKAERRLTLQKEGPGKLYYRLGLRYAPQDLQQPADDQGFLVYREYEALPNLDEKEADPKAVVRLEDGSWQVKAGTNVKVTLHIVARDRANYVVIDDAMPAGFEGQNERFVTSVGEAPESSRATGGSRWWWGWWWRFDHTQMKDDRMLLFSDHMWAGVYEYSYTARATTIGTFHLPPVKAEAMYEPERFGHSSSSRVTIVE
jgi:uncharacterized protein YfaS (alpha-2-macroglobulin family)